MPNGSIFKITRGLCVLLALCAPLLSSCEAKLFKEAKSETSAVATDAEDGMNTLVFDKRHYSYEGDPENIRAENSDVVITRSGSYRISGVLTDGSVVIDAGYSACVRILLDGAELTSTKGSPITVRSAAAVTVELAENSLNILSDTESGDADGGVIYADSDLCFTGGGKLIVSAKRDSAIVCTSNLTVSGGSITLSAPRDAIFVRDRFLIDGGRLTVTHAERGIVTDSTESSAGVIRATGGSLVIKCEKDALYASRQLLLTGGTGSILARNAYRCEREANGETVKGEIYVSQSWRTD